MRTHLVALSTLLALGAHPAHAFHLNVLAASELRIDPSVPPNSSTLTLRVHLRDDRGAALARRPVSLSYRPEGMAPRALDLRTDDSGVGVARIEMGRARRVSVQGVFPGDRTASSTRQSIEVDFDAPFVTPELVLPGEGVVLGEGAVEAVVTVRVGEVQTMSPARLAVELSQLLDASGRRRALVAGATDGSGRASLRIPATRFDAPGVVRLSARVDLGRGRRVEGAPRDLLVRARTAISLLREEADPAREDLVALHGAVVLSNGSAVPNAAIRVLRGEQTLAAARADERGHFVVSIPASTLREPGITARAVFEPTEPWLTSAESPEVQLTAALPPPVHWAWAAAPLALALAAIAWISLRQKEIRRVDPPPEAPRVDDHVSQLAPPPGARGVTIELVVVDRSTGSRVEGARLRVDDEAWRPLTEGALRREVSAGGCQLQVEAEGYAPRTMRVETRRAGVYRVQVAMQTWREALFARLRARMRAARGAEALPTPREFARDMGGARGVDPLVALVERGCYGAAAPGPDELARADALGAGGDFEGSTPRPDER